MLGQSDKIEGSRPEISHGAYAAAPQFTAGGIHMGGPKSQLTSTPFSSTLSSFFSFFRAPLTMVDSRPSSTDEKATVVMEHKSKGFFSRNKTAADDEKGSIDDDNVVEVKDVSKDIPPISFTQLFRYVSRVSSYGHVLMSYSSYSTRFEIFLDFVGLAAACASGSAQVCLVRRPTLANADRTSPSCPYFSAV